MIMNLGQENEEIMSLCSLILEITALESHLMSIMLTGVFVSQAQSMMCVGRLMSN